ncbi:MAG: hypothetical protein U0X20_12185 [Caldilineaceae bacterium]
MRHLKTQPDGNYLCLLTEDEFNCVLQCGASLDMETAIPWRRQFLRHLASISADTWIYNTIARATSQPDLFQDQYGKVMPFEIWALEVLNDKWHIPGLGPSRMTALKEALSHNQYAAMNRQIDKR